MTAEETAAFEAMRDDNATEAVETLPSERETETAATETSQPERTDDRTVPIAEMMHERERRKAVVDELAAERKARQTLEERTNLLLQRINQAPAQPQTAPKEPEKPVIPELAADPVGHIVGNIAAQQRELEAAQKAQVEQRQMLEQIAARTQLVQYAQAMEADFRSQNPDYDAAINHLTAMRHKVLEALGHREPVQRMQIIQQEGLGLAWNAIQQGRNPAEALYEIAKINGYAPQKAAEEAKPSEQEVIPPDPAARLRNIAAGQQQARSLGNSRGTGPAPLTAQRLLEMSEKDFAKMLDNPEAMALLGS